MEAICKKHQEEAKADCLDVMVGSENSLISQDASVEAA